MQNTPPENSLTMSRKPQPADQEKPREGLFLWSLIFFSRNHLLLTIYPISFKIDYYKNQLALMRELLAILHRHEMLFVLLFVEIVIMRKDLLYQF